MLLEDLEAEAKLDFGSSSTVLTGVCMNEQGFALGGEHVRYLDNLFEPHLDEEIRKSLSVAYVYLAASFFCQDRVFDEDSQQKLDIISPTVLEGSAARRLLVAADKLDIGRDEVLDLLAELRLVFFSSMLAEQAWVADQSLDHRLHFTGRSELFIFGFRLISLFKGRAVTEAEISCLRKFIEAMQHGDDLGDWRIDHNSGKTTPTLQAAYLEIGAVPDEASLEEFIYLSGFYEKRCALVLISFEEVRKQLSDLYGKGGESMIAYADMQISRLKHVSERFSAQKSYLVDHYGIELAEK